MKKSLVLMALLGAILSLSVASAAETAPVMKWQYSSFIAAGTYFALLWGGYFAAKFASKRKNPALAALAVALAALAAAAALAVALAAAVPTVVVAAVVAVAVAVVVAAVAVVAVAAVVAVDVVDAAVLVDDTRFTRSMVLVGSAAMIAAMLLMLFV